MPLRSEITDWFAGKGWAPRAHQLAVLEATEAGDSALLIAPTGRSLMVRSSRIGPWGPNRSSGGRRTIWGR